MPNPNARIERLEDSMNRAFNAIEALTAKEEKLDDAIALLLEAQIKTEHSFKQTADHLRETDRQLRTLGQETDARIRDLTTAIGELIRRMPIQ